jgi:hypothetical protein
MKKKPDILVVLAAILGLGIAATSVGNTNDGQAKAFQSPQVVQLNQ